MWDFPEDPMTWKLAEKGIGDTNNSSPETTKLVNGDFVMLAPCSNDWTQQWVLETTSKGVRVPNSSTHFSILMFKIECCSTGKLCLDHLIW